MSDADRPEGAPERSRASGNGFDSPDREGAEGEGPPAGGGVAEGNGHPAPITAVRGTPARLRGRWIVPLGVVAAMVGMLLFVGATIGTAVGRAMGREDIQLLEPLFAGGALGGLVGVWVGSWAAVRMTGGDPGGRVALAGLFGTAGLFGLFGLSALAARTEIFLLFGLALLAPGIGSAVGDRIALGRRERSGAQSD